MVQLYIATGGENFDLVQFCESDMQKLANIRMRVENERQNMIARATQLASELQQLKDQNSDLTQRCAAQHDSLTERAQAIVALAKRVCA